MSVGTHFDMALFAEALEDERRARGVTWAQVTREVHFGQDGFGAISASSLKSMASKGSANSTIVLQALLWLDRTPESLVVGRTRPPSDEERLIRPPAGQTLRFDSLKIYPALDGERRARGMDWREVLRELPRFNSGVLRRMAAGQQIGWPHGMGLFLWLDEPAASFTRGVPRGPERVSVSQAAKELHVSADRLDELLRLARIEPVRFGGQCLITRDQLDSLSG